MSPKFKKQSEIVFPLGVCPRCEGTLLWKVGWVVRKMQGTRVEQIKVLEKQFSEGTQECRLCDYIAPADKRWRHELSIQRDRERLDEHAYEKANKKGQTGRKEGRGNGIKTLPRLGYGVGVKSRKGGHCE